MKKKLLPIFSALFCVIVCMFGFTACDNIVTVHISTPEDLLKMANGGSFVLDNDIDCGGMTLNCISVNKDAGLTLNGNGHVIKNVKLSGQSNCLGLVYISGGLYDEGDITITDLGIVDFTIDTDFESSIGEIYAGAFVALSNTNVKLTRCYAKGTMDVAIKNSETSAGGLVGYGRICEFTDCLSDVEIDAELYDVQFAKATVYGGGIVGQTGEKYTTSFKHCINLSSISVDTFLAISLTTRSVLGGLGGYVPRAASNECVSAPEYMKVSTFITDYGVIGGIIGKTDYNECSRSYYCNYYSDELDESQRATLCSFYKKLNGSGAGTPVNVEKPTFFTEDFLTNEATVTDKTGKIVDIFLSFDSSVWNFAEEAGELPSLKCFDK